MLPWAPPDDSARPAASVGLFCVLWVGLWISATIFFDYRSTIDLLRQHRTLRYSPVKGRVVESTVRVGSDSDGAPTYEPVIRYEYYVGDEAYAGHEWRHGAKSNSKSLAYDWTASHPVDSAVTVYYDPAEPSRAVLMPGVSGIDCFVFVFLIPFNVITVGCWFAAAELVRGRFFPRPAGGIRILSDGARTRLRLPEKEPLWWALGAAALLGFGATFVVGFAFGFAPPLGVALATLVAIGTATVSVYVKLSRPLWSGEMDLTIDDATSRLTLPATGGRAPFTELRQEDVRDAVVEVQTTHDSDGDARHEYHVALRCRLDDSSTTARLAHFSSADAAEAFCDWLKARLRLAPKAPATVDLSAAR